MKKSVIGLIGLIFLTINTFGQIHLSEPQKNFFDDKYGLDVLLHQGKMFYPESNIASGNPYWGSESYFEGNIVIDGKRCNNQRIKYEICNQCFILLFNDLFGAEKQIILDSDKIDSVYIGNSIFIKNPISKIDFDFVQLVNNGTIPSYISWKKDKVVKPDTQIMGYSYTEEKSTKYLIYNSVLYKFKTKRELLSIFKKKYRNDIKEYISSRDIKLRSISTQQLEQLIKQIEKVINK